MKAMSFFIAAVLFVGILGCASNKEITNESSISDRRIPPGECRVDAEIVKIDSTLLGNASNDPCSKAPCIAWIKINKVIGYGAGSASLKRGDTLKTKFSFTLNPTTKETFPTLNEQLPGLNEGSSFLADIQLLPSDLSGMKKESLYLVNSYNKTK